MNFIGDNMKTTEYGFKVDTLGDVDTAYYIQQGRDARNEYIAERMNALTTWLKSLKPARQQKSFNSTRSFGTV
ncbi:RSP_7527 family protein [Amphritea sp.]|uniref:RSP_7527 family protein n=1 Tax=Amphritea sp. TaxID=1872502 RepID=UPI003A8F663C